MYEIDKYYYAVDNLKWYIVQYVGYSEMYQDHQFYMCGNEIEVNESDFKIILSTPIPAPIIQ